MNREQWRQAIENKLLELLAMIEHFKIMREELTDAEEIRLHDAAIAEAESAVARGVQYLNRTIQ